jgi:hypothetical protein
MSDFGDLGDVATFLEMWVTATDESSVVPRYLPRLLIIREDYGAPTYYWDLVFCLLFKA